MPRIPAVVLIATLFASCAQPSFTPRQAFDSVLTQLRAADFEAALPAFGPEIVSEFRPDYVQAGGSAEENAKRTKHSTYEILVAAAPGILEMDLELMFAETVGKEADLLIRSRSHRMMSLIKLHLKLRDGQWQLVSAGQFGRLELQ